MDASAAVAQHRERALAELRGARAVGDRDRGLAERDAGSRAQRLVGVGTAGRLRAEHAGGGRAVLAGERGAREQAAAADRRDDRVERRRVGDQLERGRRLACDHVPVVERVNEGVALALREVARELRAGDHVDVLAHDGRAERLGGRALRRIRVARHHDDHAQAGGAAGVGDRLRVVAARFRDDALRARRQLLDRVRRSAQLERARRLEQLALQVELAPAGRVELRRAPDGGAHDRVGDALVRALEVVGGQHGRCSSRKRTTRG